MKKVVVAFAILVSSLSFAQTGEGKREKGTPEQKIEKRVKEMTSDLNLTEKQQNEMKVYMLEQYKKREAKRSEMKANREKGEKPSDEKKAEMKKRMIDEQLEIKTKMKSILSEEQLKKMQEIHKEKRNEMGRERKKVRNPAEK